MNNRIIKNFVNDVHACKFLVRLPYTKSPCINGKSSVIVSLGAITYYVNTYVFIKQILANSCGKGHATYAKSDNLDSKHMYKFTVYKTAYII